MPGETPASLGESSAPLTCLPKASWPEEVPDWNPALPTAESLPCPSCVASSRVAQGSACPPWASALCLGSLVWSRASPRALPAQRVILSVPGGVGEACLPWPLSGIRLCR